MSEACHRLPEDLELMAAGPGLAAALASVDRRSLSERDRVRLVQARNRLVSHDNAELLADLYAVSWDEPPSDGMVPADAGRYPSAEAEVAYALGWTGTATGRRMEQARQLVEDLPRVWQALHSGQIDIPRAWVIGELAGWLADPDAARVVVDRVLEQASQLTTGQLRARLRRLVLAVDPQAARNRCVAAVKTRRVESSGNLDGSGELWGRSLPPQDTAAVWERLTAIARAAKSAGDLRSMDQLRAEAMLDLLAGQGVAVGQPLTAHTAGLPDADPGHIDRDAPAGCDPAEDDPTGGDLAGHVTGEPVAEAPANPHPGGLPDRRERSRPGQPRGSDRGVVPDPGWDPWWRCEPPPERIGAHDVHPDPTGEPVDRWDVAGQAYDGDHLWPPDWPGRWLTDPAVSAGARGRSAAVNTPPDPAGPGPVPTGGPMPTSGPVAAGGGQPALARAALPGPRRGVVELQVPLTTLLRLSDHPAELAGFGPVIADIARQVAAQQRSATWRFSVYDKTGELAHHGITHQRPTSAAHAATPPPPATPPPTGRHTTRQHPTGQHPTGQDTAGQDTAGQDTAGQEPSRRRPTAQVAAFVRARDRTCVAPGCRHPGTGCDIDHTLDWAHGGADRPGQPRPGLPAPPPVQTRPRHRPPTTQPGQVRLDHPPRHAVHHPPGATVRPRRRDRRTRPP